MLCYFSDYGQRGDERDRKLKIVLEETIGDRLSSMVYVDILATDPKSQGHGYGGMLLEAINDLVRGIFPFYGAGFDG